MIEMIISGMQTGADLGSVQAAHEIGIKTFGYMPLGFKNESGLHPEFEKLYGAQETSSPKYPQRTELNANICDCIFWIGEHETPGKILTMRLAEKYNKNFTYISIPWIRKPKRFEAEARMCAEFISRNRITKPMFAGHSESKCAGIQHTTHMFCRRLFGIIGQGGIHKSNF